MFAWKIMYITIHGEFDNGPDNGPEIVDNGQRFNNRPDSVIISTKIRLYPSF